MMQAYEKYVGLVFDNRYRIEKVIGIGGMAIVFKATDLLMRRLVAVKILKDEISSDEESVKRFTNECRAVAMLSHPNIVNIYDISVRENIKYIVMEFVEGITLKNYMQHREVLNLREMISYTTQILRALEHAHKKGIVHRDIKPQNIMLLKNGIIKVMDFGIAKLPNAETISMTDKAIGTVYYISPEQVNGQNIDCRSDLYSLGAMMYEMATGKLPFTGDTPVSVAMMQVNDVPTPPRELNPHIPVGLEQIILRAMEKEPGDRYQSATEMLDQLQKLRENPKIVFKEKKKKKVKKKTGGKKGGHQSRSMFPIIAGVLLAFLITAGVVGYYLFDKLVLNGTMNNYVNVTVEEFEGHTYTDELAEWFKSSDYYAVPKLNYVYSDTVEKDRIVSQDPQPGESRKVLPGKQRCEMTFDISLGAYTMVLDDYTVRDHRAVETELRKLGLKVVEESVNSEIYEIGFVVRTEPAAGTIMKENDTVTLYVSKGSDQQKVTVPNFVDENEVRARTKILQNDLTVGNVTYERSDKAAGTVIKQLPEAGREATKYGKVNFVVSGGPSYSGDGTSLPTEEDMMPPEESGEETKEPDDKDPAETKDKDGKEPAETKDKGEAEEPEETKAPETDADWWDNKPEDSDDEVDDWFKSGDD